MTRYPPTIRAELKGTHTFRFTGSAAQEAYLLLSDLMKLVMGANSSTSARPIFTSVKLKRISIWTPVQAIGASPTFCALRYEGMNTDDTTHFDTSATADDMAHVSMPPPRNSVAGFWHHSDSSDASTQLAWLSVGADSVVDIEISYVVDDAATANYTFTGGSGMTNGLLYYGKWGTYEQPGKVHFS